MPVEVPNHLSRGKSFAIITSKQYLSEGEMLQVRLCCRQMAHLLRGKSLAIKMSKQYLEERDVHDLRVCCQHMSRLKGLDVRFWLQVQSGVPRWPRILPNAATAMSHSCWLLHVDEREQERLQNSLMDINGRSIPWPQYELDGGVSVSLFERWWQNRC